LRPRIAAWFSHCNQLSTLRFSASHRACKHLLSRIGTRHCEHLSICPRCFFFLQSSSTPLSAPLSTYYCFTLSNAQQLRQSSSYTPHPRLPTPSLPGLGLSAARMKAAPLLVAWHDENAPIYSAHFEPHNKGRLATAGGDGNVRVRTHSHLDRPMQTADQL
jgi:hypothetical protein